MCQGERNCGDYLPNYVGPANDPRHADTDPETGRRGENLKVGVVRGCTCFRKDGWEVEAGRGTSEELDAP